VNDPRMTNDELLKLIWRVLDDTASAEEVAQLKAELDSNADARRLFRRCAAMASQMEVDLRSFTPASDAHAAEAASAEAHAAVVVARPNRFRLSVPGAIAAALIFAAGLLTLLLSQQPNDPADGVVQSSADEQSVATLTNVQNARWSGDTGKSAPQLGATLEPGRLRLAAGAAEIMLRTTASVTLHGPADLEIIDANRCRLHSGRITARVPESAIGFTVQTPTLTVVDLGTRFGIDVAETGTTDVTVFEGRVEVRSNAALDASPTPLSAGQGRRWAADGRTSAELPDQTEASFAMRVPAGVRFAHWSFDAVEDGRVDGDTHGFPAAIAASRLVTEGDNGPRLMPGRVGNAMKFDGVAGEVRTAFPGIGGGLPRTIAMWVKIPASVTPNESWSLVHWGSPQNADGKAWQVALNAIPQDGPIGRLRVGATGAVVVGETDLRDNRWHHVAIVFDGDAGNDDGNLATSTRLYVDGVRERIAHDRFGTVDTDVTGPGVHPVTFGSNLNMSGKDRYLRGAIDEAYIFDAALNADAIRHLMTTNAPPR